MTLIGEGHQNISYPQPNDIYRDARGDVWKVISVCEHPTVTMERLVEASERYVTNKALRFTDVIGCNNYRERGLIKLVPVK